MKLKANWLDSIEYKGTRLRCKPAVAATDIESAFFLKGEEVVAGTVPKFEVSFSGFRLLETDAVVLDQLKGRGHKFAALGQLTLSFHKALMEESATLDSSLEDKDKRLLTALLSALFADAYGYIGLLVLSFPPELPVVGEDGAVFYGVATAPITEEEWREYVFLHEQEIAASKLYGTTVGIGFGTSAGKVLN